MKDKAKSITLLSEVFERWEALLANLGEARITAPGLPGGWSLKDVIAHLWAWQQLSIARLEAALQEREPEFFLWPEPFDPESDDDLDRINAWIYETYHDQPWSRVHQAWRTGFLHFLELAGSLSEEDLFDPDRYPWLEGYPLNAVLQGSYEHHLEDHLEPLVAGDRCG
jgi:hypothetical protein